MNVNKAIRNLKKVKDEMNNECLYHTDMKSKVNPWIELIDDAISFLDGD